MSNPFYVPVPAGGNGSLDPEVFLQREFVQTWTLGGSSSSDFKRTVYFQIGGDRRADSANVAIVNTSRATKRDPRTGQELPDWQTKSFINLGYFDPLLQEWLFWPEIVKNEEKAFLTEEFTGQIDVARRSLLVEAEHGLPVVDVHDPFTRFSRSIREAILSKSGVTKRTILDSVGSPLKVDASTTYTLGLTPRLVGPGVSRRPVDNDELSNPDNYGTFFNQDLALLYRGVIKTLPDGRIVRDNSGIILAGKDPKNPGTWLPNFSIISREEWSHLFEAATELEDLVVENPNFSAGFVSVVHNIDH